MGLKATKQRIRGTDGDMSTSKITRTVYDIPDYISTALDVSGAIYLMLYLYKYRHKSAKPPRS